MIHYYFLSLSLASPSSRSFLDSKAHAFFCKLDKAFFNRLVLFSGYIAIMFGGLVHTFVDIWKQYQTKPDHATNMLGNWVLWVHVKRISIISGILTLWAGFIILIVIQQIQDAGAAFFAGYSIDSFVGLFLVRFTDTVPRNVAKWGSETLPKSTRQQVADVLAESPKSATAATAAKLSSHVS